MSFIEACKAGAQGIESDIHVTKDGRLVMYHDRDLGRTTDGNGKIAELPWEGVIECVPRAQSYHPSFELTHGARQKRAHQAEAASAYSDVPRAARDPHDAREQACIAQCERDPLAARLPVPTRCPYSSTARSPRIPRSCLRLHAQSSRPLQTGRRSLRLASSSASNT